MAAAKTLSSSLLLFLALSIISSSTAVRRGEISVYWGQRSESEEGTLREACDSNNYNIVIIQGLIVYDDRRHPDLNLADHCGSPSKPCSMLEPQIKHCQRRGIKVFLSIVSHSPSPSPPPTQENSASRLAEYLTRSFLSGNNGPLGAVSLDGIDIQDVRDSKRLRWSELVRSINASKIDRRIYQSASPQCVYPDQLLNDAIRTGNVDYIFVRFFYHNPCIYTDGNPYALLHAYHQWTSNVPRSSKVFLGLTAYEDMDGYIDPQRLKDEVLPEVRKASNYGGVMIWDRYADKQTDYSRQIRNDVLSTTPSNCGLPREPAYTVFNGKIARSYY